MTSQRADLQDDGTALVRFPARREDGTFTVVARFHVDSPEVEWALAHQLERSMRMRTNGDLGLLLQEFSVLPSVDRIDEETVGAVFDGRKDARMWKDWMVGLVLGLSRVNGARRLAFGDRVAGRLHPT